MSAARRKIALKSGEPLPSSDHVARYCKPSTLDENGFPQSTAFEIRLTDSCLSVNWLEYFNEQDRHENLKKMHMEFSKAYSVSQNGAYAVLAVKNVRKLKRGLDVIYSPNDAQPSHSGIFGYQHGDMEIEVALHSLLASPQVYRSNY